MLRKDFADVHKFLEALDPRNPVWEYIDNWAFRGHANAAWPLVPSAHRKGSAASQLFENGGAPAVIDVELRILERFLRQLDDQGLAVPGDGPGLRSYIPPISNLRKYANEREWPTKEVLPLMALAQHYGVPTRLLDWTRHAWTAAYFAASEAAQWVRGGRWPQGKRARWLGVWAWYFRDNATVPEHKIGGPGGSTWSITDGKIVSHDGWRLDVTWAAGAGNPHLRAQRGLFSVLRQPVLNAWGPTGTPLPWSPTTHDAVALAVQHRQVSGVPSQSCTPYPIGHYRLRIDKAPELLRVLGRLGVTASDCFPGVHGAAKAALERDYWDE